MKHKRTLTTAELRRAENRIRDGAAVSDVCRLFQVSRKWLRGQLAEKWPEILAEGKTKRCLP